MQLNRIALWVFPWLGDAEAMISKSYVRAKTYIHGELENKLPGR
jgi:hypothetical protein